MATTDQINDLIAGYTDLKAFYEGERQELINARNNLTADIEVRFAVDEVNGLPGGDGSDEAPFNEIDKAFETAHRGQIVRLSLQSDVTWRRWHPNRNLDLNIFGWDGPANQLAQRKITFLDVAENDPASSAGLAMSFGAMRFMKIALVLGTGSEPHFSAETWLWAAFRGCTIDGSQGGTAPLFSASPGGVGVGLNNTTYTGMAGRWLKNFAAGTALDVAATNSLFDSSVSNV